MKTMYKPSEYEMKLIVLFVIQNLKTSATYTLLDYVISSVVDMNYFDLELYIRNLIEVGDLSEMEIESQRVYSLNPSGEETIGFFESKIPFSIRERLLQYVKDVNEKANVSNEISTDYYPINENEYGVVLNITENNVTMLKLDVYVGDKENAKKVAEYFKANVNDVYKNIMQQVTEGAKSAQNEQIQ